MKLPFAARLRFSAWLLAAGWLVLPACRPQPQTGDTLIQHVNVVDVQTGTLQPDQQVLIKGDTIAVITADAAAVTAPQLIDGTGRYLIPGLWDMHTHNLWSKHFSGYYVGNGVLGVRNMYTPLQFIKPLRDSIEQGKLPGPYYVAAGRVVEGIKRDFPDWLTLTKPEQVNGVLDTLQQEGSDFVKVYDKIPLPAYRALMQEAKKRGLRVEGHLPIQVPIAEAAALGQRSLEHLFGIVDACTADTLFRTQKAEGNASWFTAVMKLDDYATAHLDAQVARQKLAVLRQHQTYVCPTLTVWYNFMHPDTPFETDGIFEKFPKDAKDFWLSSIASGRKKDAAKKQMLLTKYDNMAKAAYLAYQNRVPMMAGTDAINPFVYPGFALHQELKLLKAAGIPDSAVLKMATLNAARFLGLQRHYGEVKPGRVASLVLLDANPLADIANTSRIRAVLLRGKVLNRQKLDALLK